MLRATQICFIGVAASLSLVAWRSVPMQSGFRNITNASQDRISLNPSISGDGRIVAFESTEDIARVGGSEVFRAIRANLSDDPPTFVQMAAARAPAPSLSQDGSRIVFASKDDPLGRNRDGNSEIFLYNGATLTQVTDTSPGDATTRVIDGNFLPSISDDGRLIAFSSNRDLANQNPDGNLEIFICDSVEQTFVQLTHSTGIIGFIDAKISGNGAVVAYIRDAGSAESGASTKRDLLLQNRVGPNTARTLVTNAESLAMSYGRAISDDGERVVWAAETRANSSQVFLYDGRNHATRQITSLGVRSTDVALQATISGNGSCIAFATRRAVTPNTSDGSVDLYTYDIPSLTFARVTNGPPVATAEVVSSLNDDGSIIAFNFPRALTSGLDDEFGNNSEIYVTLTPARPAFGNLSVRNGASLGHEPASNDAVAPDSIAAAFGRALSFSTEQSQPLPDGTYPLNVQGTTVTVNGRWAQILYVSESQVNFVVPIETEIGTAEIIVTNSEGYPSRAAVIISRAAPGVFTFRGDGVGEGVILNADSLQPAPFDPSNGKLHLIVFVTGIRGATQVAATAGGRALTLESILVSPNLPGLDEVHLAVPADLRGAGTVELALRADNRDSNAVTLTFIGDASRDVVINEFLADPPDGPAGDANRDGVRSSGDDEFVELVNNTTHDIDIGGYQILTRGGSGTSDLVRHTFAGRTILPACSALVIFGGGIPTVDQDNTAFGGAQVFKASTGSLNLINSVGVITLRDPEHNIVTLVSYGGSTGLEAGSNQSLTRSPDIFGSFTLHNVASNGARLFSPGSRVDTAPFIGCLPPARVAVSPASTTIDIASSQQFEAHAFATDGSEVSGVIFSWQSSNPAVATIDHNGLAIGVASGLTDIQAVGRGVSSTKVALKVNPPPPVLTTVTISPSDTDIGVGEKQLFSAQAKDQFGQDIGGVTITFTTHDATVATVDAISMTTNAGLATATVTGRTSGSAQIQATATNGITRVTSSPTTLSVEPAVGEVLISEFRTRGPSGAADEFVEIYNPTVSPVIIGGLRIRASNSAGNTSDRVTITAGTKLDSGCHYLVANTSYTGHVAANLTYSTGISDDGGVAITRANGATIIDAVGMHTGSAYREGIPLKPLSANANQSYERVPGGAAGNGTDSNNNVKDFRLNTSSSDPQNSSSDCLDLKSADLSIGHIISPDSVEIGSDFTYVIDVTNKGAGTAHSVVVTDILPDAVTLLSCSSTTGGVCGGAANQTTVIFDTLPAGSSAAITFVVRAGGTDGSTLSNTATVSAATLDPHVANNSSIATTSVRGPSPTLSINDVSAEEGDSGTTTLTFTVTLSAPALHDGVTFNIATNDGSATVAGDDYVARGLTRETIAAGQQTYSFDVAVNADNLVEPNETFVVNVTNVFGATVADGQGLATIRNDDRANLVISQVYAGGGNSGASFRNDFVEIFNRGKATVNYGVTPYSIQYSGATANFGSSKVDLTDGLISPGHYFLVQLSSGGANGGALPSPDSSGSISMAATAGKVALVVGTTALPSFACPGDDGSAPFNPNNATIADFVGYGGAASCYEGSKGPAAAPSSTSADIRKAGGCTDTDDNASDFTVSSPFPRNHGSPANNCVAGANPSLTINDVTIVEGNGGTATAIFTVSLSEAAPSTDITFDISTEDNTATVAGHDYLARSLSGQMIVAGRETYVFAVTLNGDTAVEPEETFFVNVTNVVGAILADGQGVGTIQNDDLPTLSIDDASVVEGDTGTKFCRFTVVLSAPVPVGEVTFDIATADGTAQDGNPESEDKDYVAQGLTKRIIVAGNQTDTFDVAVNGDINIEPNETFFVNITNVTGAKIVDGEGAGTIENDDTPKLSINDVADVEGNTGTKAFTFTVISSLPAPAGGITFDISTQDSTATTANGDYATRSLMSQSIPAGQTTYTFDVTVAGDKLVEPDEAFFVNLANVSGATISDGQGKGTIQNDDSAELVISQVYGGGGNSGASYQNDFVEILNHGTTTVNFALTPYSIQYAGATASFGSNKVVLGAGIVDPGKYFLVQLSSGGANGLALPAPDATGSINMAATAGKVALVAGPASLPASACPGDDGMPPFNPREISIADFVSNGASSTCYEGPSGPAPAPSNATADVRRMHGCTDTNDNSTDFVTSPPNPRNATSAINDCNAIVVPELRINDAAGREGNTGTVTETFTVTLSQPAPAGGVTFDIATQDDSATVSDRDYTPRMESVQLIPAGSQTYSFEVKVNGDTKIEPDESFLVNVTNVSGATLVDGQGVGIIQNDDSPLLSVNDISMNEGNSGSTIFTFTIGLSAPAPPEGVTFDVRTDDGTAQGENPSSHGKDYISQSLTAQTISAGGQTYSFEVIVNGDSLVEPNETFLVSISNVSGASVLDNQGQGAIENDDTPLVVISQIYGGGGNTGAIYQNDFVELFNRGTATVDFSITPYSVQYASATGTFGTNKTDITSGAIAPGHYFLIREAGGATGIGLPIPDATGTINLAATSGKVALVLGTSALNTVGCPGDDGVSPFNPNVGSIADFLGYGTSANCYEGSAPLSVSGTNSNARSVIRTVSCSDTNKNSADFSNPAAAPVAHNSTTTPAPCP